MTFFCRRTLVEQNIHHDCKRIKDRARQERDSSISQGRP